MGECIRFTEELNDPDRFPIRAWEIAGIPSPRLVALRYNGPLKTGAQLRVRLELVFNDKPGALCLRQIHPDGKSERLEVPSDPDELRRALRGFFSGEATWQAPSSAVVVEIERSPAKRRGSPQMTLF